MQRVVKYSFHCIISTL